MAKHLKSLNVPASWPVKRKATKFMLRPSPGKPMTDSLPIALVFKNLLKYTKTMKEVKTILMDQEILIDCKRIKDPKSPLGIMYILSIPVSEEYYTLLISKAKKLYLHKIEKKDTANKVCKIIGKTMVKKGKMQLNLYDGKNFLVKEGKYTIGDSVVLSLPDQKIKDILKLEKGNYALLTKGSHVGMHGIIQEISVLVKIKTKTAEFETTKESVFVIGKKESMVAFKE